MAALKLYVDLMSQPSRAVTLFIRLNNIPHELRLVQIKKLEHLDPDFKANVSRFGRVPAIVHNGKNLIESIGILRYLSAVFPVAESWYPKDPMRQAKVDEFLEWQHIGLRLPLSMFFQTKFIRPLLQGKPSKPSVIEMWQAKMDEALDEIENIWLKDTPYLTGNHITIADLVGICEIDQPRMGGYEPGTGRPKLQSWMTKVRADTQPHYDSVTEILNIVIKKYGGVPPSDLSRL